MAMNHRRGTYDGSRRTDLSPTTGHFERPFSLCVAVLLILMAAAGRPAVGYSGGDLVAFRDGCDGRYYAMNPDGTGRHVLPDLGGSLTDVSRVGPVTILVAASSDPSTGQLWAVDPTGSSAPVKLLQPGEPTPFDAVFSPGGDLVAFIHDVWNSQTATLVESTVFIGDVGRDGSGRIVGLTNVALLADLFAIGQRSDTIGGRPFMGSLDFAPDGRSLVVVS
jgi:hypothetical protein